MRNNNWVSGSTVIDLIKHTSSDSVSGRVIELVMSVWDNLVSKSVFIAWITGKELRWRPVVRRRGLIGGFIFICWSKFLGFLRILFGKQSAFQRSFIITLAKNLSKFACDLPFVAFGTLGAGFFGLYGILKMTVTGVGVRDLILIIVCFAVSVLLMLIRVSWSKLIESSWIITRFQEIDD